MFCSIFFITCVSKVRNLDFSLVFSSCSLEISWRKTFDVDLC